MDAATTIHLQTPLMEEKDTTLSGSPGIISQPGSPPKPLSTSLPMNSSSAGAIVAAAPHTQSFDLLGKKKRGRPRKYDADGNLRVPSTTTSYPPPPGFTLSSTAPSKKPRARNLASPNSHLLVSLGGFFGITAGGDFIPHVLTVHAGEVPEECAFFLPMELSLMLPCANLVLLGRFEILSLSGSFTLNDNGSGIKSRTGGLSVSLSGPDGRVIGGGVAGLLVAASPIQIVMGSFMPNGGYSYKTHKKKQHREHTVVSPTTSVAAPRPISQPNPEGDQNCLTPTMQFQEQSQRESEDVTSDKHNSDEHMNDSEQFSVQTPYPDINISLPAQ
ncbi:AT-hook motif nuclear-localized protein 7-like [Senna tora]|uniref:AT-hook motif nuclear-localized protein n=1 Tax=Senna tora TaxID=362788 RepID=A0A834TCF2_9FABA|nr:AT-hook motif nuclear-localized protein 7-like [Senna tora]